MLSYLLAVSSYFNPCRLICELYCPILAHIVLFANYIVLFQHILSYLQAMSSYFNPCHPIYNLYPLIFKLHNLISSSVSSYFHPIHHPIYNSYHDISTSYHNLFANIVPPYLQLCHAMPIICPIFSPSKPIVLFLEIRLYNIVIATKNS